MPTTSKSLNAQLLSLLPSHATATLPAPLVDLTAAIVATSRARVPGLKGDEELAREYVCAFMAIDKLKGRLNLPDADLKPPVPPRVFQRLLGTFEKLIPMSTAKVASMASRDPSGASSPAAASASPSVAGKKRKAGDAPAAAAAAATPPPALYRAPTADEADEWIRNYLRDVEVALTAPPGLAAAASAGLRAVFPEYAKVPLPVPKAPAPRRVEVLQEKLGRTLVALVLAALPALSPEGSATAALAARDVCRKAVEELIVRRFVRMTQYGRFVAEAEAYFHEQAPAWREMDWWRALKPVERADIPVEPGPTDQDVEMEDEPVESKVAAKPTRTKSNRAKGRTRQAADMNAGLDDGDETQKRDLPRNLASWMKNNSVDWLSPERQQSYVKWHALMLRRIDEVEARASAIA